MRTIDLIHDLENWRSRPLDHHRPTSRSLCALRLLRRYLNPTVMKMLLTSNYYSSLYYNSEIWLSNNLKHDLKQSLLSASANVIRSCVPLRNRFISFEAIHKECNFFTPTQMGYYKLSILLHKLYNSQNHSMDWRDLANLIIITRRQTKLKTFKSNIYKIGMSSTPPHTQQKILLKDFSGVFNLLGEF